MPTPTPRLHRDDLLILIKNHLAAAAPHGLTRAELREKIGPTRTSLPTIQRALDKLRSDHAARIRYDARTRRWHLDAPLALPLTAPEPDDVVAVLIALAILEHFVDPDLLGRLMKLVEDLDQRVRERSTTAELPSPHAMSSTLTLGTRVDPQILRAILTACRRKALRIRYASPWRKRRGPAKWQTIEPWALRIHDGAIYLRAWSSASKGPTTFRLAHITELRELDTQPASRHTPPADSWGDQSPAFGIDVDRPNTAVIRMRGDVARWVSRIIWHPTEQDNWLVEDEVLVRTLPYRSCRELARRLASILDGIESIEPRELRDEVKKLVAHAADL